MPSPPSADRGEQIARLKSTPLDVLVIGGGINGAGVIRDLALRGPLRIGLVEKGHFGSGTSGKNSQLIHGGLRYLKYFEFSLVRESLHERSLLLRNAPDFVKPLPFLLPMYGLRSRLLYGTGLWMYDRLAGSHNIAEHRMLSSAEVGGIEPSLTRDGLTAAAIFYDGAIDSARFVVENVLDAIGHGAIAANYVRVVEWRPGWIVVCEDTLSGERFELTARKLVDARGAWGEGESLRLVRGSHIVIPRVNASDNAIAHFEPDGRIIFLIPWGSKKQLTLVGTTDEDHKGGPDHVRITGEEISYLRGIVRKLYGSDPEIISAYSSLRPLIHNESSSATSASRGHRIWNSADGILHIAGGKYTTYRAMSEEASDLICREIAPGFDVKHPTLTVGLSWTQREIGDAMEQHLSDYLFFTTYLGYERRWNETSLLPYAQALGRKRGWDASRVKEEIDRFLRDLQAVSG